MACYDEDKKVVPCPPGVPNGTILVSKAKDPRLKAYNDSLNIYNSNHLEKSDRLQPLSTEGKEHWNYKNISPIGWVENLKNPGGYPVFKKPVQPVVYQKPAYKDFLKTVNPDYVGDNYNLEEAYNKLPLKTMQAWAKDPEGNHLPDTYKLPNHPTFSDESKYYKPGMKAIHWNNNIPTPIKRGQSTPYDDSLILYNSYIKVLKHLNDSKTTGEQFWNETKDWPKKNPEVMNAYNRLIKYNKGNFKSLGLSKERDFGTIVMPDGSKQRVVGQTNIFKKPTGTPELQEPTFKRPIGQEHNYPVIDNGIGRPNVGAPNMQQANFDMSKPTKFAFTYPDYEAGQSNPTKQQKSLYFPDLQSLASFSKGYGIEPSSGGDKSWGQALYKGNIKKANGGSLSTFASMRFRKVYDSGGQFKANAPAFGAMATGVIDAFDTPNQYGRQSTAGSVAKGALSGAAAGSQFGPWGAAIGGAVGLVGGIVSAGRQKREEAAMRSKEANMGRQSQLAQFAARAAQNPYLTTGRPGEEYFADGGSLKTEFMRYKAKGGSLSKLSTDSVEVKGPSHSQGGVQLPGQGAEVEGGETIKGDYVLSKRLGFAQLHKPIAKAIGLIEKKTLNPITMKSLSRLRDKENALIVIQEYVKNTNNLQ